VTLPPKRSPSLLLLRNNSRNNPSNRQQEEEEVEEAGAEEGFLFQVWAVVHPEAAEALAEGVERVVGVPSLTSKNDWREHHSVAVILQAGVCACLEVRHQVALARLLYRR